MGVGFLGQRRWDKRGDFDVFSFADGIELDTAVIS